MEQKGLALHETLEMHEILMFKNVCLTKSKTMQNLAQDNNLKTILQKDVEMSTRQVQELQGFLANIQQ